MAVSLIQDLQIIFESLCDNPNDVPYCSRYLLGVVEHGMKGLKLKEPNRMKTPHGHCDAILRFLVIPRTEDEVRQLLDGLSHCSFLTGNVNVQAYHTLLVGSSFEQLNLARVGVKDIKATNAFIVGLFDKIIDCLRSGKFKSVAKGAASGWLSCPQDLMPFGPIKLIESLLQWARLTQDITVYWIIGHIEHFCGPPISKEIVAFNVTHIIIDAVRDSVNRTVAFLRNDTPAFNTDLELAFLLQSESFLSYIDMSVNSQPVDYISTILRDYELKFIQVVSLLAHITIHPRFSITENRQQILQVLSIQGN